MQRSGLANTRLVTLSVCNGGLVRFGPGDELHGLIPACLSAGAANVLTTLWSVGDSMTALWMRAFYRRLAELGPASAALAATSGMIANGAALRDWAPFVLIGASLGPP
jgi:CHAT domain-containing protein